MDEEFPGRDYPSTGLSRLAQRCGAHDVHRARTTVVSFGGHDTLVTALAHSAAEHLYKFLPASARCDVPESHCGGAACMEAREAERHPPGRIPRLTATGNLIFHLTPYKVEQVLMYVTSGVHCNRHSRENP